MAAVTGKLLATLRGFIREALYEAGVPYHAPVRYRVVVLGPDKRLHLQIVRKASGFPDVLPIAIWPGVPGGFGEPALGSIAIVQFVEGDPSLPIVTHFAAPSDANSRPSAASLDATTLVRIGEHAVLTQLGSGDIPYVNPAQAAGRTVRWGDTYVDPVSGPVVLVPGPGTNIAKVKA